MKPEDVRVSTRTIYRCKCDYHYDKLENALQCGVCRECGKDSSNNEFKRGNHHNICDECSTKLAQKHMRELLDKATEISYEDYKAECDAAGHTTMLYIDEDQGYDEPMFFEDIGSLEACHDVHKAQLPEFCFATTITRFSLDVDSILEDALSEHHEDAYDTLIEVDKLREFVDAWVAQQPTISYHPDYTRKIRVPVC